MMNFSQGLNSTLKFGGKRKNVTIETRSFINSYNKGFSTMGWIITKLRANLNLETAGYE
jgi:hypothetical protein